MLFREVDIAIIQRFNGQLPDINQISSLIEQQITAKKNQDEGIPPGAKLPGGLGPAPLGTKSVITSKTTAQLEAEAIENDKSKKINGAITAVNALVDMRLERYMADVNLIKACPALL
jgi:hypothetical protein